MSTITELIARLRSFAKLGEAMEQAMGQKKGDLTKILFEAADTIEALRLKLSAYMLERTILYGGWIPVEEHLPELHEEDVTDLMGEKDGVYKLSEPVLGMLQGYDDKVNMAVVYYEDDLNGWVGWKTAPDCEKVKVIAWMPLPEPYRGKTE